jgi:hypothetical protein
MPLDQRLDHAVRRRRSQAEPAIAVPKPISISVDGSGMDAGVTVICPLVVANGRLKKFGGPPVRLDNEDEIVTGYDPEMVPGATLKKISPSPYVVLGAIGAMKSLAKSKMLALFEPGVNVNPPLMSPANTYGWLVMVSAAVKEIPDPEGADNETLKLESCVPGGVLASLTRSTSSTLPVEPATAFVLAGWISMVRSAVARPLSISQKASAVKRPVSRVKRDGRETRTRSIIDLSSG